jgi:hypothetical protein
MTKILWRRAKRLDGEIQADAPPDFGGWTDGQKLVWAARNGRYEEIVARANEGWQPRMAAAKDGEAEPGAEQRDASQVTAAPPPQDGSTDADPQAQPAPERQPEYWEEKCQWRHRGPDDCDWEDRPRGYEYEHEYDPLEQGWQEIVRSSR